MAGMPEMQEQFPAWPWMAGMPEMQEQFPAWPWMAGMPEMQEQFPAGHGWPGLSRPSMASEALGLLPGVCRKCRSNFQMMRKARDKGS
jgi:hypothetical protein